MEKEGRIFPAFQKDVSIVVLQDLLKRIRKPDILLLRPLLAPLGEGGLTRSGKTEGVGVPL